MLLYGEDHIEETEVVCRHCSRVHVNFLFLIGVHFVDVYFSQVVAAVEHELGLVPYEEDLGTNHVIDSMWEPPYRGEEQIIFRFQVADFQGVDGGQGVELLSSLWIANEATIKKGLIRSVHSLKHAVVLLHRGLTSKVKIVHHLIC